MIPKLQQIFHSIIKSLEVLYVIEDAKPCARIMVFEDELDKVLGFLEENKIKTSVSDFKVVKQNIQSDFYSDKSVKIEKSSPQKGYFFVYLSKDISLVERAKIAEEKNDHKGLGMILGYPECCCEFFEKSFDEENTDLTLKALENSNGYEFSFYTNIAARHFDISLLSHFPHSFDCKTSIEIAKKNLEIINKNSKDIAKMFENILKSIVIYTKNEGIFLIRKYEKAANEIIYGDVLTTARSKLYYLISSNKIININNKNNFAINDVNLEGKDYGIMIFI